MIIKAIRLELAIVFGSNVFRTGIDIYLEIGQLINQVQCQVFYQQQRTICGAQNSIGAFQYQPDVMLSGVLFNTF